MGLNDFSSSEYKVIEKVETVLEPILLEHGFELFDIHYKGEGRGRILRIFLDKEGGITIDECAAVSRELAAHLDVHDLIPGKYTLEVSSPSLTRPPRNPRDYIKHMGKKVKIVTMAAIEKRTVFVGTLIDFAHETAVVEIGPKRYSIPFDDIVKANLEVEF